MRYSTLVIAMAFMGGCNAPGRLLTQPTHVGGAQTEYIYFIEQEANNSSRIKKCDIMPDNTVNCSTQFDLAAQK